MQHDIFICHASEDKNELVRPLAAALRQQDVDVWYDEFSLKVGDSLRQSIDRGLAGSRFGAVVLSPSFFRKPWPQWELNGLVSRMLMESRRLILPIWHYVEIEDVTEFSPSLADIRALQSHSGLNALCSGILAVIRPNDSPLLVARDELARFGWNSPPISDEWWLSMVEAQSSWDWPIMERQWWRFPLPIGRASGRERGLSIAWTALQLDWQREAEDRKICQTTPPETVFAFIDENPALKEICENHPDIVANFVPQLLIPEFSGRFGAAFDRLLAASARHVAQHPDSRFPDARCERRYALRLLDFGENPAGEVADKWMDGLGGDYSAQQHHITDYIVWLLSQSSIWLPVRIKQFLIRGMRDWGGWRLDLTHEDIWPPELAKAIYARPRRAMRWTKPLRVELENAVSESLERLGVAEPTGPIASAFIDLDFTGALFDREERWKALRRRGN